MNKINLLFMGAALLIFSLTVMMSGCNPSAAKENTKVEKLAKDTTPRVTGIGGIFFKSKDPKSTKAWYGKNLGLATTDYGSVFEFRNANNPKEINYLCWSTFKQTTDYFKPSEKEFMINYRVNNLEGLLRNLKKEGIVPVDTIQQVDYGKFVHVMDPDGNKIELWEPVDSILTKLGSKTNK